MGSRTRITGVAAGVVLAVVAGWASGQELTLEEAEQLALQNDPVITQFQARAAALMEQAVAAGRLPDPQLKFGAMNVPYSPFSFSDEPMTQTVVGIQQMFPPMGMLSLKEEQEQLKAEVERAKAMTRALAVLRNVRMAWMDVYYNVQAASLVKESQEVFDQLVKITQYQYRAGRGTQQDVIRAQLELSMLKDRETAVYQQQEMVLSELNKWLGELEGERDFSLLFPQLPELPTLDELQEKVRFHPQVAAANATVGVARKGVALAKSRYKPGWMLDVSYGARSGERSDFLSAMVMVDLPFFTGKRQDKVLNARGHDVNAARDAAVDAERELKKMLESQYAEWKRLGDRLAFYRDTVLPQAAQYSEASRRAYQSRVSDFSELVRARLRELEANLAALKLRVDRAKAHYNLKYVAGEGA